MKDRFVITAISKLMRGRVEISGPMPEEMARERLNRELDSRKRQKYQVYSKLRVERVQPVQLSLKFEGDE